jgi:lysyl-tRNA synthetase class 2
VVGGFEKVFEVARNFRNEDIDTNHNPEFSMVEIYWAYRDFNDMMALTENFITSLVWEILGSLDIMFGDAKISFVGPWKKHSMADAVKEYAGIDVFAHTIEELQNIALTKGMELIKISKTKLTEGKYVEEVRKLKSQREFLIFFFEIFVEENLIQPTFIYDFPIENSPLAKKHRSREGFTERFELFIYGMEIANGFSELNDPVDQRARFEAQDEKRRHGDAEAQMIDYDFINALGYGMPPTGGVGVGIDRLVMLLTNENSIKEVILFPQMKNVQAEGQPDENNPL